MYDIEKSKAEASELKLAFREMFPLAGDFDLPQAPCHIKQFLRDRIEQETLERVFHFQSRVVRILCEISPPKTHVEDMTRIVVEEAKKYRAAKRELEALAELKKERNILLKCIREIGKVCGCNHTEDEDGWKKLVSCVDELVHPLEVDGEPIA